MNINELYSKKGELVTQLEILQGQLQQINGEIVKLLQAQQQQSTPKKEE